LIKQREIEEMNDHVRLKSPFYEPENYCTSQALSSAVRLFYKISDADAWYKQNRKSILDKVKKDQFGFAKFETIHKWHEYQLLKARYGIKIIESEK